MKNCSSGGYAIEQKGGGGLLVPETGHCLQKEALL
jgi:hypothetical protein